MEIFLKLSPDIQSNIEKYLNTHKIKYHDFNDKVSWAMINIVNHVYCIRTAPRKAWKYISKQNRFGTKRTYENYEQTNNLVGGSPLGFGSAPFKRHRLSPKWKTVVQKHYNDSDFSTRISRNTATLEQRHEELMKDLMTSSVTDKYNDITFYREYKINMGIYQDEDGDYTYGPNHSLIENELNDKIKTETLKDIDMLKSKLKNIRPGTSRQTKWNTFKILNEINMENIFEKLNQL